MDSSKSQYAFIDEFGDSSLVTGKDGVTNFFIVTAILVDQDLLPQIEKDVENVRKKYFKESEIKSNKVGKNDKRRLQILDDLSDLDFHIYSLVVDKNEIQKDSGLKYKKSFLKFLNGQLYKKLYSTYPDLHVVADEQGRSEFKISFEKYLKENHIPDLFYRADFKFEDSRSNPMIQVADFFSGTIARLYEPGKKTIGREDFFRAVDGKILLIEEWPPKWEAYRDVIRRPDDKEGDLFIRTQAMHRAKLFIESHDDHDDPDILLQLRTLKHLLYQYKFVDSERYIPTRALIEHLKASNFGDIKEHYLRSKVIGPLRDYGVIIASSNKGLKIPSCLGDVVDYVDRINDIVQPMLNRLETARRQFLMASKNRIDIVSDPKFEKLKKYLPL
jgi:hypothetical protein